MNAKNFSLFVLFLAGLFVFTGTNASAIVLPSIYIRNISFDKELSSGAAVYKACEKVKGFFDIIPDETMAVTGLIYEMRLVGGYDEYGTPSILYDRRESSSVFLVAPGKTLKKEFEYNLPCILPKSEKEFGLEIAIKTYAGETITHFDRPVDIETGESNFVFIKDLPFVRQGENYNLSEEGLVLKPSETAKISFQAISKSEQNLEVILAAKIYRRGASSHSFIKEETGEPITIQPGEIKELNYFLPASKNPQSYFGEIQLRDKEGKTFSNILPMFWVVEGNSAEILSLYLDKTNYKAGETANTAIKCVGSIDNIARDEAQNQALLKIALFNEKGEEIGAAKKAFNFNGADCSILAAPVAIKKDGASITAKAEILQNGQSMAQYQSLGKLVPEQTFEFSKKIKLFFAILAVFFLFLLWGRIRNKSKINYLVGCLVFVLFGFFFNPHSSLASVVIEPGNSIGTSIDSWASPAHDSDAGGPDGDEFYLKTKNCPPHGNPMTTSERKKCDFWLYSSGNPASYRAGRLINFDVGIKLSGIGYTTTFNFYITDSSGNNKTDLYAVTKSGKNFNGWFELPGLFPFNGDARAYVDATLTKGGSTWKITAYEHIYLDDNPILVAEPKRYSGVRGDGDGTGYINEVDGSNVKIPGGINCKVWGGDPISGLCFKSFPWASSVRLLSEPELYSAFDNWEDVAGGARTCAGKNELCVGIINNERNYVSAKFNTTIILFNPEGNGLLYGKATFDPAGSAGGECIDACNNSFPQRTTVTVKAATTDPGAWFVKWGTSPGWYNDYCDGSTSPTCVVSSIKRAQGLSAEFGRDPLLIIKGSGSGSGSVKEPLNGNNIDCSISSGVASGDCQAIYSGSPTVILTAASIAGSAFTGWSGSTWSGGNWSGTCAGNTYTECNLTISADKTVTANFTRIRILSVTSSNGTVTGPFGLVGEDGISCGANCSEKYNDGATPIVLTVVANGGYTFSGWSGDCSGAICSLTMNANKSVTANFTPIPPPTRTLTVTSVNGTVTGPDGTDADSNGIDCRNGISECSDTYNDGTLIALTATPDAGVSVFSGWSGDCSGNTNPCSLPMSGSNKSVIANFDLIPTADIKADGSDGPITIPYNTAATISWTSTDATSCSVPEGPWTGISGSQSTGNLTSNQTYTLSCSGPGGSDSDSVIVSVNQLPVVDAGGPYSVNEGASIPLNGATASGPEAGDILDYIWSCDGGLLSNNSILNPDYTAPLVSSNTDYTCTLSVNDGINSTSVSDSATITVADTAVPPPPSNWWDLFRALWKEKK